MDMTLAVREKTSRNRRRPAVPRHPLVPDEQATAGLPASVPMRLAEPAVSTVPQVDQRLLAKALTIRQTEERLLALFSDGKLTGTVHTCIGQEWVGVAVAEALRPGDYLFSNHRGHGHYLAWTDDVEGLAAELMARSTGVCGGRGGSQHLCRDGFFSNGIQGGIVPVAAGLAMASRLSRDGRIAAVFIGDGTLGEGIVYETLNIAARWMLPLLIVLEDNGIAQSTEQAESLAGSIHGRARAFGIEYRAATTDDPADLVEQAADGVDYIRQTSCPLLLHVRTARLRAHSKGDDTRDVAIIDELNQRDPLNRIIATTPDALRGLRAAIEQRLDAAISRADAAPTTSLTSQGQSGDSAYPTETRWQPLSFKSRRVVDAIREALAEAMAADERIVLLGEDLRDPYGGAFKVTSGLSERFGDRVINTPISEAAIVGIGNGLALAGRRPLVEIMFGDFLLLAADQIINHAAKFAWMYNGQASVPIIIRTPMGGYRGYGPTHSQCLEKHLLGVPGTRVLALHARCCPGQLYRTLLQKVDRPTLVIENKLLYGQRTRAEAPTGCEMTATDAEFPTVRIRPNGERQITVVTYGGMVPLVESALTSLSEDEELACDLLIPTQLYPLHIDPIVESARETGRLLVVEEGQGFAGFASEVIAQVAADPRIARLDAQRVCASPCPIPAAKSAESEALPDTRQIIGAAVRLVLR